MDTKSNASISGKSNFYTNQQNQIIDWFDYQTKNNGWRISFSWSGSVTLIGHCGATITDKSLTGIDTSSIKYLRSARLVIRSMLRSMSEYHYKSMCKAQHKIWLDRAKSMSLIEQAQQIYPSLSFWCGYSQPGKVFIDTGKDNISSILTETIYHPYIGAITGCETANPRSNPWAWNHDIDGLLEQCAQLNKQLTLAAN